MPSLPIGHRHLGQTFTGHQHAHGSGTWHHAREGMAPGITRPSTPGCSLPSTTGALHLVGQQLHPDAEVAGLEALGTDAVGRVGLRGQPRQALEHDAVVVDHVPRGPSAGDGPHFRRQRAPPAGRWWRPSSPGSPRGSRRSFRRPPRSGRRRRPPGTGSRRSPRSAPPARAPPQSPARRSRQPDRLLARLDRHGDQLDAAGLRCTGSSSNSQWTVRWPPRSVPALLALTNFSPVGQLGDQLAPAAAGAVPGLLTDNS